jgi:hypothetical protein
LSPRISAPNTSLNSRISSSKGRSWSKDNHSNRDVSRLRGRQPLCRVHVPLDILGEKETQAAQGLRCSFNLPNIIVIGLLTLSKAEALVLSGLTVRLRGGERQVASDNAIHRLRFNSLTTMIPAGVGRTWHLNVEIPQSRYVIAIGIDPGHT